MDAQTLVHRGGCHCGRVRFEVRAPRDVEVLECNCSICRMLGGYQHLIVDRADFRLVQGEDALSTYTFNTGTAQHRVCGVKSFYVPRSHPEGISVSARCLDPGTLGQVRVRRFEGAEWEAHAGEIRATAPGGPDEGG